MIIKESLYSSAVRRFRPDLSVADESALSQPQKDLYFALRCNGFFLLKSGEFVFDSNTTKPFTNEFEGQSVSFFGPNAPAISTNLFSGKDIGPARFMRAFERKSVTDMIGKYREADEDLAARISFLFGGIIHHLSPLTANTDEGVEEIANEVEFAARMTMLAERRSADAVASAMAMYVISGGPLHEDKKLAGNVYHMAEAVAEDRIVPLETKHLGLSQVRRLRTFLDTISGREYLPFPNMVEYEEAFDGFPTVGAEFHFPMDAVSKHPDFWQRLSLLNISQYQRGSYVQLSRNDRDVIEVRMNPSTYPVTIANWRHMKLLLPELNRTSFTVTLNRNGKERDFSWKNKEDTDLLNKLRTLGLLTYAGIFANIPTLGKPEEIDYGAIYLGQTVRMVYGEYKFTGTWYGGEGTNGQLGIYAGFGNNLPHLAYYLSMALAEPDILRYSSNLLGSGVKTLKEALEIPPDAIRYFFRMMQSHVELDLRLLRAHDAGNKIMELLKSDSDLV